MIRARLRRLRRRLSRRRIANGLVLRWRRALSGYEPPLEIEQPAPEQLEALLERVRATWRHYGAQDPYWSVLSDDGFRLDRIEGREQEFFATGEPHLALLFASLERAGVDAGRLHSCLELGCGLGRVTRHLAEHFDRVYAYDVSAPHLTHAREQLERAGLKNVELVELDGFEALARLPRVDLACSLLVLQHNPPPVIELLIRALLRALAPGGVAFFQALTYQSGYRFAVDGYLAQRREPPEIEMHVVPQHRVFEIVYEEGCVPLEIREDWLTGTSPGECSNTFVVRRPPVPVGRAGYGT